MMTYSMSSISDREDNCSDTDTAPFNFGNAMTEIQVLAIEVMKSAQQQQQQKKRQQQQQQQQQQPSSQSEQKSGANSPEDPDSDASLETLMTEIRALAAEIKPSDGNGNNNNNNNSNNNNSNSNSNSSNSNSTNNNYNSNYLK